MDPIEEQLLAYNTRDLDRFLAVYSSEVVIEDGENHVVVKGLTQMRERYAALFAASPNLHCRIVNRIKIGSYTVDEEEVSGWNNLPAPMNAVIIYRVEGDQIVHVRMLR
jgi:hypothetical protein